MTDDAIDRTADPTGIVRLLLDAAGTYLDQERWVEARRCAEEARAQAERHRLEPLVREAMHLEGRALAGGGDATGARDAWDACLARQREAGDHPGAATILCELGDLHLRAGRLTEAADSLKESLRLSSSAPPGDLRARALEVLGTVQRLQGDLNAAVTTFSEALRIREAIDDDPGVARNHTGIGNTYHRMGRLPEAIEHHRRCLEICERLQDRRGVAKALNNLGTNFLEQGDCDASADHFHRARQIVDELDDARMRAHIVSNLGLVASYRGLASEAEGHYRESLDIRRSIGDLAGQAISLNNLSNVAYMAGRYEEAITYARQSIDTRTELGLAEGLARPWFNLGLARLELREFGEAEEAARQVESLAEQMDSAEFRIQARLLRAGMHGRRGRARDALSEAGEAVALARVAGLPRQQGEALRIQGEAAMEADDLDAAREALLGGEALFRDLRAPYNLAKCQLALGQLFVRVGATDAAVERLRRAHDAFERLGNGLYQWRCLAALAEAEWPVSRRQSRATLAAAIDLARRIGRADLVRQTEALGDELPVRASSASGTARTRSMALPAIISGIGGKSDPVAVCDDILRQLVESFDLEVGLIELLGPPVRRIGPWPPSAEPPDQIDELIAAARSAGELQFRRVRASHGGRLVYAATPVRGLSGGARGVLVTASVEDGDQAASMPEILPAIGAVASTLGMALQLLEEPRPARDLPAPEPRPEDRFHGLVGRSESMRQIFSTIERIGASDASVLIQGESGTGKELVARAIHEQSGRRSGPFVAISCPNIPRELIEAELFGHEKGAFTGAHVARNGRIEAAHRGTLLLDEVGDMDLATQSKLLRFLQEREFQRIGGRSAIRVDVRLLAATSRNLDEEIRAGRFREDLFYRISVVPIRLPALRSRVEDIPILANHFLSSFASTDGRSVPEIDPEVLDLFSRYGWPGNVRELQNLIEYLVAMNPGEHITLDQIPARIRGGASQRRPADPMVDGNDGGLLRPGETLEARLMSVEGALIRRALESSDWVQSRAARVLGITESKVRQRMKRYGIRRPT